MILLALPERREQDRVEVDEVQIPGPAVTTIDGVQVEATELVAVVTKPDTVPETGGDLFIVIDDVGNNLSDLEYFLDVPGNYTFAILPDTPFAVESAERIRARGHGVILHQPMEAIGGQNPGPSALFTDMSQDEVLAILAHNIGQLKDVKGVNNHMGSKATADPVLMEIVMRFLKSRDLFFLDSVTSGESVAKTTAEEMQVSFAERNSLFLDNEDKEDLIQNALETGIKTAELQGSVVLIGHVKSRILADIISARYQELTDSGFVFRTMDEFDFSEEKE